MLRLGRGPGSLKGMDVFMFSGVQKKMIILTHESMGKLLGEGELQEHLGKR